MSESIVGLKQDHLTFQPKNESATGGRLGLLSTPHGEVETPTFMPVGTAGSVKGLSPAEIRQTGSRLILGNAYHLYLRPGIETVREGGGLAQWSSWGGPTLTDSGGYQIFSLAALTRLTEDGVEFRSHLDGSKHFFSPESVMAIQEAIGADIVMPLDHFPGLPAGWEEVAEAVGRTGRWARRAKMAFVGRGQALFGIVQGGAYPDLRERSAKELCDLDFPGYAIGGLSVGETKEEMYGVLELLDTLLPREKPRYLMGVGSADALVEGVARGIDLFDSVFPTRLGRHGALLLKGGRLVLRNARFARDFSSPDPDCDCFVCRNFNRSYLHHLFRAGELLGPRLASYHNLRFTQRLMEQIRRHLAAGTFEDFRRRWAGGTKFFEGESS